MKKMIPLFVIAIFLLGIMAGFWLNHNMTPFQKETNWAVAIEHVMPATVSITATRIEDATTTTTRAGTGIIVTSRGVVLTSKHLLGNGFGYTITLSNGTSYPAKMIKEHTTKDLALLEIISDKKLDLPTGSFANSTVGIQSGEKVVTIGNMLGLYPGSSVEGMISGLNRTVFFGDTSLSGLIQTSIAATMGNSGGPLIYSDGTIIGIMIGIVGGTSQIGWALPVTQEEVQMLLGK